MISRFPIFQGGVTWLRMRCRDTRWMRRLRGWGALSVIEGGENVCDYGEELQGGTPMMLSLNFEGLLCAPMRVAERESWWVDYWKDREIRAKYFNVTARQLKNTTQCHQGRIWVLGKILVQRRREIKVISRYHDSPAAGDCGISRATGMVKRNYVFKGMRRKVRAYVRTCDVCQRVKADTHLPRGKMWHLEIPVRKWSVSVDFISLPETTSRS